MNLTIISTLIGAGIVLIATIINQRFTSRRKRIAYEREIEKERDEFLRQKLEELFRALWETLEATNDEEERKALISLQLLPSLYFPELDESHETISEIYFSIKHNLPKDPNFRYTFQSSLRANKLFLEALNKMNDKIVKLAHKYAHINPSQ